MIRYSGDRVEIVVSRAAPVSAPAVYDVLADLSSHIDWGGRRQLRAARIRSLRSDAPTATAGTRFESVGGFPGWRLLERHTVVTADRPVAFEFVTETDADPTWGIGRPWKAGFRHRYEIETRPGGCGITYRFEQTRIEDPPPRFRWPVVRSLSYRIVGLVARRGLRNLAAVAAERAGAT